MARASEDAATRIEAILHTTPDYDFVHEDDEEARRCALRDLHTDVLHAADEWCIDIEDLGGSALDVAIEEDTEDEAREFFEQASESIEQITNPEP